MRIVGSMWFPIFLNRNVMHSANTLRRAQSPRRRRTLTRLVDRVIDQVVPQVLVVVLLAEIYGLLHVLQLHHDELERLLGVAYSVCANKNTGECSEGRRLKRTYLTSKRFPRGTFPCGRCRAPSVSGNGRISSRTAVIFLCRTWRTVLPTCRGISRTCLFLCRRPGTTIYRVTREALPGTVVTTTNTDIRQIVYDISITIQCSQYTCSFCRSNR